MPKVYAVLTTDGYEGSTLQSIHWDEKIANEVAEDHTLDWYKSSLSYWIYSMKKIIKDKKHPFSERFETWEDALIYEMEYRPMMQDQCYFGYVQEMELE